jgi:cytochrome c biogenesis protein CcmG/thiol:disulfide interchange protein DsbE
MGRRRARALSSTAALALILGLAALLGACGHATQQAAAVGKPAPPVSGTALDGKSVQVADLRGSPVLLNEFPVLQKGLSDHPDLRVVGVVFDDSASSARRFASDEHAGWPSLTDPGGKIASKFHVAQKPGIPVSVLIGADGTVRGTHLGPFSNAGELADFLATPSGK